MEITALSLCTHNQDHRHAGGRSSPLPTAQHPAGAAESQQGVQEVYLAPATAPASPRIVLYANPLSEEEFSDPTPWRTRWSGALFQEHYFRRETFCSFTGPSINQPISTLKDFLWPVFQRHDGVVGTTSHSQEIVTQTPSPLASRHSNR